MSKARIEPFSDGLGNTHYRVTREFPTWSAAERGRLELDQINPAGFDPKPGEPFDPYEGQQPPNCEGFGAFVMGAQLDDALASEGDGCGIGLCVKRDEP